MCILATPLNRCTATLLSSKSRTITMHIRFCRSLAVMLATLTLAGCGFFAGAPPAFATGATPEAVVEADALKRAPPGTPQGFTWLTTRLIKNGAVVMYTTPQFGEDASMFQLRGVIDVAGTPKIAATVAAGR
jgi:hypothetical protein